MLFVGWMAAAAAPAARGMIIFSAEGEGKSVGDAHTRREKVAKKERVRVGENVCLAKDRRIIEVQRQTDELDKIYCIRLAVGSTPSR